MNMKRINETIQNSGGSSSASQKKEENPEN